MGGSKKQTVGYRYSMGLHMGVCLSCDALLEIRVGDRVAWRGLVEESRMVSIYAPQLFGGDEREGGLLGSLDVMMGEPDQGPNLYLTQRQGGFQPGYRGFMGLVYRGRITSNNPYIKNWAVRARGLLKGWHNDTPWYPERAPVPIGTKSRAAIYFALDMSGSMSTITSNGQTRLANLKTAINGALDFINVNGIQEAEADVDIMIVGWGTNPDTRVSTFRRACTPSDIAALKAYVSGMSNGLWTYFPAALMDMSTFFADAPDGSEHIVFFVTDGEPSTNDDSMTPLQIAQAAADLVNVQEGVKVYGINIDAPDTSYTAMVDNAQQEVPVVAGGNPGAITSIIAGALGARYAINPVHIVYQCLTDPDWGMGYPVETIDDASFRAAADTLAGEGLGLALKWVNQSSVRAFTQIIADHAALNYGQSRKTGKFEIQLLRQDYDPDTLPVFNKENCRLIKYQRPSLTDTVNEIVIDYVDIQTGDDASTAPLQNLANIMAQGRIVSQKLSFPGIPTNSLAARVGMRELQSRSTPLWKMTLAMRRGLATNLKAGQPFVVDMLDTPLGAKVVMRAVEIDFGTTVDSEITAECVEDVFGMPASTYVGEPDPPPEPPDTSPKNAVSDAFELPYREVLQYSDAAAVASLPPDAGFVGGTAVRPAGVPLNYSLHSRVGTADYVDAGQGDFAPSMVTAAVVPKEQGPSVVEFGSPSSLDFLELGSAAWLGNFPGAEMVRVDAINLIDSTITLGRGCGDTVPKEWPIGTRIWGFDAFLAVDPERYVDGELVDTKITTNASGGQQPIETATTRTIPIASRLARPYPPGQFQINGQDYPAAAVGPTPLSITAVPRDRLLQADTLIDTAAAGIGPEPGTTYTLRGYENDVLMHTESGAAGFPITWVPSQSATVRIQLESVRDGLPSWQYHEHELAWTASTPDDVMATNILAKMESWWPLNETAGPYLKDVHGGVDLQLFGGGTGTAFSRATIRTGGPTCLNFTGNGGAFVWGNPEWWIKGTDVTAIAWARFNAATKASNRTLLVDAPATDASEAYNQRLQWWATSTGSTPPNRQGSFWEYGPGTNVDGPGSNTDIDTAPHMLAITRYGTAKSVSFFRNGVPDGGGTYVENPTGGEEPDNKLAIGNVPNTGTSSSGSTTPADADLQDMALFRTPLTTDEIAWLHNGGAGRAYDDIWTLSGQVRLWTPVQLRNKVVWGIADDPDNTLVTTAAQRLSNRTGFAAGRPYSAGYSFTNSLSTLNGRPVLSSDNGSNLGMVVYPNTKRRFKSVAGITMVSVHRKRVAAVSAAVETLMITPRSGSNGHLASMTRSRAVANEVDMGGRRLTGDAFASYGNGVNHGTAWLIAGGFNDYSAGTANLKINGNATLSASRYTTGLSDPNDKTQECCIGGQGWNTTDRAINHELAEWLFIDGLLTSTEWEKLEGYLAHRWGLTANLPAGHPYKATPPLV